MRVAVISCGLGHVKRGVETWSENLGVVLHEKVIYVTVYQGGGNSQRFF